MVARAGSVVLDKSGTGDYTNFVQAYGATAANDTIYVVTSTSGYGSITISSPRTFIGMGHTSSGVAQFSTITLNSGAQGSKFASLAFSTVSVKVSNVDFIRCKILSYNQYNTTVTGINYKQCYFQNQLVVNANSGVNVSNSIFVLSRSFANAISGSSTNFSLNNCTFYQGRLNATGAKFSNCVANTNRVPTRTGFTDGANGNKADTEANLKFNTRLGKYDDRYKFLEGSTATGKGAYATATAYEEGGKPSIPEVLAIDNNVYSKPGSNLIIKVKAKTNN